MQESISESRLKELLEYDPDTGVFTWLITPSQRTRKGMRAGSIHKASGYRRIKIDNVNYQEHRLAFLYMTGSVPQVVDHIDQDRSNNKWCNLRASTHAENSMNIGATRKSKTGHQGVYYNAKKFKYQAYITKQGRKVWQQSFDSCSEAVEARRVKLLEFGFHPNHGKEQP